MIYYLSTRDHTGSMVRFLRGDGRPMRDRFRCLVYEDLFRKRRIEVVRHFKQTLVLAQHSKLSS